MSFYWRDPDRQKVEIVVRFKNGFAFRRVPFWTPYDIIARDALEAVPLAGSVVAIEDRWGKMLWRPAPSTEKE